LVELDTATARRGVAALPWIDRVQVDRSWRGTITIRVSERVPSVALPSPIGTMLVDAVLNKDMPLVQALVVYTTAAYLIINLLIDVLYGLIDPRIRHQRAAGT
ncbi:MAG: FtsQ-type POTRA domain-containing protein, partial [Pseudomonadota bacterium]